MPLRETGTVSRSLHRTSTLLAALLLVAAAASTAAAGAAAAAAPSWACAAPGEAGIGAHPVLAAACAQQGAPAAPAGSHVVISEVEVNPPGDDRRSVVEWVELHNPSGSPADVGGWSISSTDVHRRTLVIPNGTEIKAGGFGVFYHRTAWFADVTASVRLHDAAGRLVDATPRLDDRAGDLRSWSRTGGGPGTGSDPDWEFGTATAGSSNLAGGAAAAAPRAGGAGAGAPPDPATAAAPPVSVSTGLSSYALGERVVIQGNVSEDARASVPPYLNRGVSVSIEGPSGYVRQMALYPDGQLRFFADIRLDPTTGASEGRYTVTASYAGSTASSTFLVGGAGRGQGPDAGGAPPGLSIATDRASYRPGETAVLSASVGEILPLEGLSYTVYGPDGAPTHDGRLYPDPDGRFEGRLFINTIGTEYGNHTIAALYGEAAAVHSFEVSRGSSGASGKIVLGTDKAAYAPGETVTISGRLNGFWSFALELEMRQVAVELLGPVTVNLVSHAATLRPAGDGTFSYEYRIANSTERLGEYVVRVSDTGARAETSFRVEPGSGPGGAAPAAGGAAPAAGGAGGGAGARSMTVTTDSAVYELGSRIVFSGSVQIPQSASFVPGTVKITVAGASGGIVSRGQPGAAQGDAGRAPAAAIPYQLSAAPDAAGNYRVADTLHASVYPPGPYAVLASYADGRDLAYTAFAVVDSLDIAAGLSVSASSLLLAPGEAATVTGIAPRLAQGSGIDITVHKPGGDTDRYGALADRSRFEWVWTAPSSTGVYQAVFKAGPATERLFFRVSDDPSSDAPDVPPLSVSADREVYGSGDEVAVRGLAREGGSLFGSEGPSVRERVTVAVKQAFAPFATLYEYSLNPDSAGYFGTSFKVPIGIFDDGEYSVVASYLKSRAATSFRIDGDYDASSPSGSLSVEIGTDRAEYRPGETVAVSGRLTRIVSSDGVDVTVVRAEDMRAGCGTHSCGSPGSTARVMPGELGEFSHTYKIGAGADAAGLYIVQARTAFATASGTFAVAGEPVLPGGAAAAAAAADDDDGDAAAAAAGGGDAAAGGGGDDDSGNKTAADGRRGQEGPAPARYTETFNRVPDSVIPITASESDVNGTRFVPRALQGLLFKAPRDDPSSVDLRLVANVNGSGSVCVVGPAAEEGCLVSGLTRAPGTVYETVQIGGVDYRVRYAGPGANLERFSVLPAESGAPIDIEMWTAEVIRQGDAPSWFYYKLTRVAADAGGNSTGAAAAGTETR